MLDYVIASEWNGRAARKEDLREIERVSGNGTRLSSFYAILNYFCLLNFETKFSPENNPKVVLQRISFHKEKSSSCRPQFIRPQAQSRRVRSERKAVLYEKLEQALAFPWTPLFPRGFHRIETEKQRERERKEIRGLLLACRQSSRVQHAKWFAACSRRLLLIAAIERIYCRRDVKNSCEHKSSSRSRVPFKMQKWSSRSRLYALPILRGICLHGGWFT